MYFEFSKLDDREIDRIKEKYSPGTKIRIKRMMDDHAPEDGWDG